MLHQQTEGSFDRMIKAIQQRSKTCRVRYTQKKIVSGDASRDKFEEMVKVLLDLCLRTSS